MRTLREIEYNPIIEIGKYYAYKSHGKLCVGQAIRNPNPSEGFSWGYEKFKYWKNRLPIYLGGFYY